MSKQALTLRETRSIRLVTRLSTREGRTERLWAVWREEARRGLSCFETANKSVSAQREEEGRSAHQLGQTSLHGSLHLLNDPSPTMLHGGDVSFHGMDGANGEKRFGVVLGGFNIVAGGEKRLWKRARVGSEL